MSKHKAHLQHTIHHGPTCQSGRIGGQLRGEHFTYKFEEFVTVPVEQRCSRCSASKLAAYLERQAAKKAEA